MIPKPVSSRQTPTGLAVNVHGDDAVAPPGLLVERPLEQVPADGVHVQPHQYAPADALPVVRRHDAHERSPRAGLQLPRSAGRTAVAHGTASW